jgi:fructosamine-3-kinase
MINWQQICTGISVATQSHFALTKSTPLPGGDSSQAWLLSGVTHTSEANHTRNYFVKLNTANRYEMFAAECAGLGALAATQTIRVPQPVTHGVADQHSFLVLEYVNFAPHGDNALLGNQLAAMHRHHAQQFGWQQNNTIGTTAQINAWQSDWVMFWREQRLGYQLDLAAHNGYGGPLQKLGRQVLDMLPELFDGHTPRPSLLHGDLWGGNHGFLQEGSPIIFDPATYYGDRETDIAMSELFGGFAAAFYSAYQQAYPLHAGYARRKIVYNLYHILNHCNMLGGAYAFKAEGMMLQLLQH